MPARCSANAPPPPLKEYALSILNPILEESANAMLETLQVKPYKLAETAMTDVVMNEALTPEVLERMKALNDPKVQEVLAGFKTNVEKAVQESSDILKSGVADNIGELAGQVANKLSESGKLLVANIPGVGIGMAMLETADAAALVADKGKGIVDGIQSAMEPITAIQSQVAEVKDAVDAATASEATGQLSEATGQLSEATASAASEATGQLSEATASVKDATSEATGQLSEATASVKDATGPLSKVESEVSMKGGSRKRRHIHKLSRRIERTLRRVQKKYGLRDKNDFLRRTLRVRKMK